MWGLKSRTFSYPTGFTRIPWGNSYFGHFYISTPIQRKRWLNWATSGFHGFQRYLRGENFKTLVVIANLQTLLADMIDQLLPRASHGSSGPLK